MLTDVENRDESVMDGGALSGTGQGDRTRAKILAAAVDLIDDRGEAGLRVVDVAAQAGVAVASIYTYFANRDDLVISARIQQYLGSVSDDLEKIAEIVDHVTDPEQMKQLLHEIARATVDPERKERRWRRAEVLGAARRRPKLATRVAAQQHASNVELSQIVKRGQERGLLDPTLDPMAVAVFVQGYTFGLLLADVDPATELSHEAWLQVVDRFVDSIVLD